MKGNFGDFGGQFVSEDLKKVLNNLENEYEKIKDDKSFIEELNYLLKNFVGRPSILYYAKRMSEQLDSKIYFKREDLNHTGSHKINNALGQALLAKKMGKNKLIAETGAGQHGVATAAAAAILNMECEVYMGAKDIERQALNVYRMRLLGAKVHSVTSGSAALTDAVDEALQRWIKTMDDTHYLLGSALGPHPFPTIVRDFQKIIGEEIKEQLEELEGRKPDAIVACVGGGSNAIGAFYEFISDKNVALIGCEAAGEGVDTEKHAATITKGSLGIHHGMKTYFLQQNDIIQPTYSISAGLNYPGIGPEHAELFANDRAKYVPITDKEALEAFEYLSKTEGIIPAIESAHAVAYVLKNADEYKGKLVVINISGRGDKDVAAIGRYKGENLFDE